MKTICVDFDGVIHSYTSGWKGPRTIPDPPVPGALEWIATMAQEPGFKIAIYSSRSRYFGARFVMRRWLIREMIKLCPSYETSPRPLKDAIAKVAFADPWDDERRWGIKRLVDRIDFPTRKPAAWITIDDRAFCFEGSFPSKIQLISFMPWYKR
jgi:hypothetical protein